jgi:hypothetical protein
LQKQLFALLGQEYGADELVALLRIDLEQVRSEITNLKRYLQCSGISPQITDLFVTGQ